ncbi:hypothetical protein Sjap_026322 [Stephania japonica]|uniref:Uncharacterized protein n=1 Tax=Stephania japonica TaxID=461633 RepID=A0AAP0E3G4_9MAGN
MVFNRLILLGFLLLSLQVVAYGGSSISHDNNPKLYDPAYPNPRFPPTPPPSKPGEVLYVHQHPKLYDPAYPNPRFPPNPPPNKPGEELYAHQHSKLYDPVYPNPRYPPIKLPNTSGEELYNPKITIPSSPCCKKHPPKSK